jgi:predicted DsbA family dithiol-disulfide isomerase
MNVAIDIVSDLVCPWCFIGKRRLAQALARVREKHPAARFQLNWLPYFLDPDTPPEGVPYRAFMEARFGGATAVAKAQLAVVEAGAESGVDFDFGAIALRPNTLRAHRLIYRAQSIGHRPEAVDALVDRLFVARFQRGEDIGDIATLAAIAAECGDDAATVTAYLESGEGVREVRALVDKVRGLGVSGVPFFIVQRRLAVSGAQTAEVLAAAILQGIAAPAA